jgi:hypothetical protein
MLVRAIRLRNAITHFLDLEALNYIKLAERGDKKPVNERKETSVTRIIFQNRMKADNWALAVELVKVLEPIKECTKILEGRPDENSANGISQVYPLLKVILANLEKLKDFYFEHVTKEGSDLDVQLGALYWAAIKQGWNKASLYYNILDNSPVYTAAVFLDPRLYFAYLVKEWGQDDAAKCVRKVRDLWVKDYRDRQVTEAPSSQETVDSSSQDVPRKR